jgi:serine-type D-Ala-D-Ala carboxypeptidase (penicillin-binding protein 5/6)
MTKFVLHCLCIPIFSFLLSLPAAAAIMIPSPPSLAASAYLLMDSETGQILVESNIDQQLPPASLTKMMTSYIVSDEIMRGKLKEDDMVLITDDAWARGGAKSGGSTMFLDPRIRVAVMDLLKGVIIQSGNDASIALAQHLAGSEDAFAEVMNQYAKDLGMNHTHFVNATGWPADDHLTTARDLAILARAAINNHPEHYPLYSEKSFTFNGITQPNRNRLLHRDPTVDGLKTGHTEAAGYCLVASAKKQGMRLISVVLGAASEETRAVESQKLLAYGFRYYQTHTLYTKGAELTKAKVWKGKVDEVALGVGEKVTLTIPTGAQDQLKASVLVDPYIQAPLKQGQKLGDFTVAWEGKDIYKAPIVALVDVEQAGFFARVWDSIVLFIRELFA